MNKKTMITVLVAVIALAAGWLAQRAMRAPVEVAESVKPLDFSFPDTGDRMQSLSQWHGKILVINFWATWCAPCLKEIPEFVKLQAEYRDRGLQFIGIAIEDRQPVLDYLQRIDINYPVLIAGDAGINLARQLGNLINAVPFTVIVDPAGRIVYRQPGELSADKLMEVVTPLMAVK